MKFSTIILGVAFLCPSVVEGALRRKKKKPDPKPDPDRRRKSYWVGATVTVMHMQHREVDVDPNVLAAAYTSAFNWVHKGDDIELLSTLTAKAFKVPEDDYYQEDDETLSLVEVGRRYNPWWHYAGTYKFESDGHCRYCRKDLDDDAPDYLLSDDPYRRGPPRKLSNLSGAGKHKALEADLCKELRDTNLPGLQDITHCYVEFTYSAARQSATNLLSTNTTTDAPPSTALAVFSTWGKEETEPRTGSVKCEMDIDHVQGSAFDGDNLIMISDIFKESYNILHANTGYQVKEVDFNRRLDIPQVPGETGPAAFYNRMWWMTITYACETCDNPYPLPPTAADVLIAVAGVHKAFEDIVCLKLAGSGLPAYGSASDCAISFGFSNFGEMVEAVEMA